MRYIVFFRSPTLFYVAPGFIEFFPCFPIRLPELLRLLFAMIERPSSFAMPPSTYNVAANHFIFLNLACIAPFPLPFSRKTRSPFIVPRTCF